MRTSICLTTLARWSAVSATVIAACSIDAGGQAPRFYPDDPIARVEDTVDATSVQHKSINLIYDEARNLFGHPGDPDMNRRAMSINTIDEVPDSSWFTNRIISDHPVSVGTVAAGLTSGDGPAPGTWTVVAGKSDGVTPGFTVVDAASVRWFIKFDPPNWHEMASGAEVVVTKLFTALGYNVPQNYVTRLRRENLVIGTRSRITAEDGGERHLTQRDIDRLLRMAAQDRDGSYRVLASRQLEGRAIGPFLYEGTRPDDPNDVVPHEHRRELRALRVFAAWTNHVDSKAINSLDTVITYKGRSIVRHHLIDFGSTLGSASIKPREYDEGHHYIVDFAPTAVGVLSLGLYVPKFHRIDYPDFSSVGYFSAEGFDPPRWKPRVPNPAFRHARPDDTFWAARRVMAFTDEMIRAVVRTGQYSDPGAERHIADTLIGRRDAIGRAWLTNVNPITDPVLAGGALTFGNAAVAAGVARAPESYEAKWFVFDNTTHAARPFGDPVRAAEPRLNAPAALPTGDGSIVRIDIAAVNPPHPSWQTPVQAYFRYEGSGWKLVGFERLADGGPAAR